MIYAFNESLLCHSGISRNPGWTPAFAGVTEWQGYFYLEIA